MFTNDPRLTAEVVTKHLTHEIVDGVDYGNLFCEYRLAYFDDTRVHRVRTQNGIVPILLKRRFYHCLMTTKRVDTSGATHIVRKFLSQQIALTGACAREIIKIVANEKMFDENFDSFVEYDDSIVRKRSREFDRAALRDYTRFGQEVVDQAAATSDQHNI
jgi:hypothetical protein